MTEGRTCHHCAGPLPTGCRRSRVFCSRRCGNAATWARSKAERLQSHRVWRAATRERYAVQRLAAKAGRCCEECNVELSPQSHRDRRYCSRRCINAVSLRTKRAQRHESTVRRRALLLAASVPGVRTADWIRLVNRHDGCCAYCGRRAPMTMDHVVPLSRGGRHSIGNLLPACLSCNSAKRDDLLACWRLGGASTRRYTK